MTRKLKCGVEAVVAHGEQVYTVTLRPTEPAPAFRPGQFLHLALDAYDPSGFWPESRVFSIASSPLRRQTLEICYAVKGQYTTRMEAELREGRAVWVKMPYGEFIVDAGGDVVLLAGGTGISAFTAALDTSPATERRSMILGYGARTAHLLIHRPLVEKWRRLNPSCDAIYFAEHAGDTDAADVLQGRVSVDAMWHRIPRPLQSSYYISGPPAMLRHLTGHLHEKGVADTAIHVDAWE